MPAGSLHIRPGPGPVLDGPVLRVGSVVWIEQPDGQRIRHVVTYAGYGCLNLAVQPG